MALSSALIQEGVSRASSYISSKLEDKASGVHIVARLEVAVSDLELALERSGKMPITELALLRRRKVLKHAYIEGTDLLNKHKLQLLEGREEIRQVVTVSSFLERVTRAANLSISYLLGLDKGHLSSSVVQIFEWYADCAGKFLAAVESGCSLRHHMFFSNPLVRHLLEGKTLRYEMAQGSQTRSCLIWPIRLEERGVEAQLVYQYWDLDRREKNFCINMMLRLSEDSDIVGIAIKCLRSLASQYKLPGIPAELGTGELTLLASNSQDISHSYAPPWVGIQQLHNFDTQLYRPDPFCCTANGHQPCANNIISSELSSIFPEQVIRFRVQFYISALEYRLSSSSDEAGKDIMREWPHLKLSTFFFPHFPGGGVQQGLALISALGSEDERINMRMQQMFKMVRSKGIECSVRQPELTKYTGVWASKHGFAFFEVEKPSPLPIPMPEPNGRSKTRRAAKRRRGDP